MRLFWVLALAACGRSEPHVLDKNAAKDVFEEVPIDAPPGMSDLTIDNRGVMWGIAERDRVVLEIELGKPSIRHPLDGVPAGVDTEAITWLDDSHFAIGTEGANEATASILFAELKDQHVVVTRTRPFTNAELGVQLTVNHGIEALCGNGNELLAATESFGKLPDGTRYAALARLRGDALTVTKVRLTTDKGKLSALYCTLDADGSADVTAIERHYSVSRILHFEVKRGDTEVTPTVMLDLAPILRDTLNLEGITRLPDGRLVAINDNQGSTAVGPTELLVFAKR
jgi:Esterase-like activity of phytase